MGKSSHFFNNAHPEVKRGSRESVAKREELFQKHTFHKAGFMLKVGSLFNHRFDFFSFDAAKRRLEQFVDLLDNLLCMPEDFGAFLVKSLEIALHFFECLQRAQSE